MNTNEALKWLKAHGISHSGYITKDTPNGWVEYEEGELIPLILCDLNKADGLCPCENNCTGSDKLLAIGYDKNMMKTPRQVIDAVHTMLNAGLPNQTIDDFIDSTGVLIDNGEVEEEATFTYDSKDDTIRLYFGDECVAFTGDALEAIAFVRREEMLVRDVTKRCNQKVPECLLPVILRCHRRGMSKKNIIRFVNSLLYEGGLECQK